MQFGEALQLHIIESRKAERQRGLPAALWAWTACLLHNLEEGAMSGITHPPVRQALEQLESMYCDEELCLAAERLRQWTLNVLDAQRIEDVFA